MTGPYEEDRTFHWHQINTNGTYGPFSNNRYVFAASEVSFTERFQSSQTTPFHICSCSA
ncbi:hypothetical protein BIFCAT_00986 [Bifidobacterium catenulatum DSM 16992 = JCM 1194 = LMG 11043]|uniref:Uncharacterized protein n=1 Tax=Bifidobacterium catenulatum DSM 16992 = JCM 1194 = LMG 11043 TaxID=566552 RepID=B6XV79_9BIFI|nr:hypothetical protein BIFCAT_00986 [Bifidobacterium catenulatum DSM 16992 = JCM 1194 = LMG 11043]